MTLRRVGDVGIVAAAYHVPSGGHRRQRGAGRAGQHSEHAPLGPAVQGAGRNQEGHRRRGQRRELARSGRVRSRRRGAQGRLARRGPRHSAGRHRKVGRHAVHRGRSRTGQAAIAQAARTGRRRHQPHRRAIERLGLARRLAAVFPASRPHRKGHAQGSAGSRQEVSAPRESHAGHVHSHRQDRRRPRFPRRPTWPSCSTATRAAARSPAGEAFDVSPANIDARSQRMHAARGHQGRAAAQEDARRNGQPAAGAALRQPRLAQGLRGGGRLAAAADAARHEESHAAADSG